MDGVSAAASIIGIIQLASQALKAINYLRDFCEEDYANKLKNASPQLHLDLRTTALAIQVEDCAQDLQKWLKIAARLRTNGTSAAAQHQQSKQDGLANGHPVIRKWLDKGRSVWIAFVSTATRGSRANLYERLRWHQTNIGMSLTVFGRRLDLYNADRLRNVEEITQAVQQKVHDEAENFVVRLDSLSASSDSLMAHSRSTAERLKDVKTETSAISAEIREVKDLLLEVYSHSSSRSSTRERSVARSGRDHHDLNRSQEYSRHRLEESATWSSEPQGFTVEDPRELLDAETESRLLSRATRSLVDALQNIRTPTLGEYISTLNAMTLMNMCRSTLHAREVLVRERLEPVSIEQSLAEIEDELRQVKAQLVRLRRLCNREGLTGSLELVDREFDTTASVVEEWIAIAEEAHTDQSTPKVWRRLSGMPFPSKQESSMRMAEWMFGVIDLSPPYMEVYQSIFQNVYKKTHPEMHDPEIISQRVGTRQLLKFWFIDSEDIELGPSGASHMAATIVTDTTLQPVDLEMDLVQSTDRLTEDDPNFHPLLLRSMDTPILSMTLRHQLSELSALGPSDDVPFNKILDAEDALESYREE